MPQGWTCNRREPAKNADGCYLQQHCCATGPAGLCSHLLRKRRARPKSAVFPPFSLSNSASAEAAFDQTITKPSLDRIAPSASSAVVNQLGSPRVDGEMAQLLRLRIHPALFHPDRALVINAAGFKRLCLPAGRMQIVKWEFAMLTKF